MIENSEEQTNLTVEEQHVDTHPVVQETVVDTQPAADENVTEEQEHANTLPLEQEKTMELVDEDENLRLYCYRCCSENDSHDWKMQRSVVKDHQDNIVAMSLPYTDEYVLKEGVEIPALDIENYTVYPSVEGTLMRVFHDHGKWYISTNRKLDAFKSYWSSHFSFGQLFVNNVLHLCKDGKIETFFERLETSNVYFFLLKPTVESRIVCHIDTNRPSLYYLGSLEMSKQAEGCALAMDGNTIPEVNRMTPLELSNVDDVLEFVRNVNVWEYQGVILFHRTKNIQVKILNDYYKYLWSIRNNNPNLFLRYFEIRTNPKLLEDFFKLYPKFVTVADRFEYQIFEVSKHLHQAYVDRYIRKQYVSLPKQEYVILKKAHDWHNVDRNYNRIYRTKMLQLLNDEKPVHLYQIIKRHFKY